MQLPRLYNVYKEMGIIQDFQTMLDNIFIPLFEVTADPSSHPQLHVFLQSVSDLSLASETVTRAWGLPRTSPICVVWFKPAFP